MRIRCGNERHRGKNLNSEDLVLQLLYELYASEFPKNLRPMTSSGSTSVRVSRDVHRRLKKMAEEEGVTLSEAIDRLLEERRRTRFFEGTNQGFADLRNDEERWEAYQEETKEIDSAAADGLEDFPYVEDRVRMLLGL